MAEASDRASFVEGLGGRQENVKNNIVWKSEYIGSYKTPEFKARTANGFSKPD